MIQVPGSGLKAETFKRVMRKRNNNMPACPKGLFFVYPAGGSKERDSVIVI